MSTLDIIYVTVMLAVLFVVLMNEYYSWRLKVVPGPSMPWARKKMVEALQKHAPAGGPQRIMEPGSGWGGLARAASRAFPDAQVEGYELSLFPFLFSLTGTRKHLRFYKRDFTQADWNRYDTILCYLTKQLMSGLSAVWAEKLPPGALVISNAQPLPGWTEIDRIKTAIGGVETPPIYVYRKD